MFFFSLVTISPGCIHARTHINNQARIRKYSLSQMTYHLEPENNSCQMYELHKTLTNESHEVTATQI